MTALQPIPETSERLLRLTPAERWSPRQATLLLSLACVFWGLSFPLMPVVTNGLAVAAGVPRDGLAVGATINVWRYVMGAVILALAVRGRWRGLRREEVSAGLVTGTCMGLGMFFQILGLAWVVPSVSGMITALPVIMAPMIQSWFLRRPVGVSGWLAAIVALGGCAVLTLGGADAHAAGSLLVAPPFPYAGEVATFLAAACFTGHIISVDHFGQRVDTMRWSVVMLIVVVTINGGLSLFGRPSALYAFEVVGTVFSQPQWLVALAGLVLLSTVGAVWLMNAVQPAVPPARAAVIYTMEPIFAVMFSLMLGQEHLTMGTLVGGTLVVAAALSTVWIAPQRK